MNIRHGVGRHLCGVGAIAVTAAIASAGVALASIAIKDASYSGHYKWMGDRAVAISFKVSANGQRVIGLEATTPFKCRVCTGFSNATGGSAPISKGGTFKLTVKLNAGSGIYGTDTITGMFQTHGRAKGTVSSHFYGNPDGTTVNWTATAATTG